MAIVGAILSIFRGPQGEAKRTLAAALVIASAASLAGCASSAGNTNSNFSPAAYTEHEQSPVDPALQAGAAQEADKLTSAVMPGNAAYKIGPLDVLEISVFRVPDMAKVAQVSDVGTIDYPLVGEFRAAGKSARQLEVEIAKKLGDKYVKNPQVSVLVREYNSQRITVEGSVHNPGVFPLKGPTSLVQSIAMSGGINADVSSGDIVVFRTINGVRSAARFDIDAVKKGAAADPQLQPNDVIIVESSTGKVVMNNILKLLPLATTAAVFTAL
jgi:polysaccharide export outer membrane protein